MSLLTSARGVIFDMDGVLLHSAASHRAAFEEVFLSLGIGGFHYEEFAGWRTRDVVEEMFRRHGRNDPAAVEEASLCKTRLAKSHLEADYPLDKDCGTVLAQLASTYRLGLASSGSRASVEAFVRNSGAHGLLGCALNGGDVQHAKPDPEIYARAMQLIGLRPEECVVVEDAVAGIQAARGAGASAIGIEGTVNAEQLARAGAAQVLPSLAELPRLLPPLTPLRRSEWTAIIPAAGKGSRLGYHRPKILFPVAGRMILEWMLDFLEPCYDKLVFVLSPDGSADVQHELDRLVPGRYEIAIQQVAAGMGDAVEIGLARVNTPQVSVIWGDQVTLQRPSVETCQRLHAGPLAPDLTCPTVPRANPYIHFDRDETGALRGLLQAREGDPMPARGESDTGFFCFRTERLRHLLVEARSSQPAGARTGEFNLLPVIPRAVRQGLVLTPRVMRIEETMGINSPEDALAVESFLRRAA